MKKLSGKIYWIADDFSFNGNFIPKKDETSHTVSKVEDVVIDEHVIKFTTTPVDYDGEKFSYNVNLLADEKGLGFTGTCNETTDRDWKGEIKCELFENKKTYFIYGKWTEDDVVYTWWARIDKNANR